MKDRLDTLDKSLVSLLTDDGRVGTAESAARLGVSTPTVRSRMRQLIDAGVLRIAGVINPFETRGITVALVGLTLDKYRLEEKLGQIADLDEATWAAVVTGRYDIIVEVVTTEGMSGLYAFLNESLQQVGGIQSSEMFVVMKARHKWIQPPSGLRRRWREGLDED
ncbi:MAG: Lrp/AsnC family transcriptional regulator [Thermoleophilia bacterium]